MHAAVKNQIVIKMEFLKVHKMFLNLKNKPEKRRKPIKNREQENFVISYKKQ